MTGLSTFLADNPMISIFLIAHFLSDFQLQSQETADKKNSDKNFLIKHLLGVALPLVVISIIMPSTISISLLVWLSHAVIDFSKPYLAKILKLSQIKSFAIDQILHIFCILGIVCLMWEGHVPGLLDNPYLKVMLFMVLITKPSNITFKIFFDRFQPRTQAKLDTISGAGAMIGNLERIVIGICMVMGQFASVGLVFTAKSIARYDKISKDPVFAEYYLIGSLFSILSVFVAAWICFF
ncbi:DUF3307 domain-containing protein [Streptococcus ictaluri]|uniref:DUF3307 domain-containing protein n=1 Tax=Streptococcus ictaluri 707-05 TaxID=764299 RepID=G5K374_9STRE|nr:DUF3307 domain-containing protein [Streptococcus ictaluri]EHI69487.1 hypothetical protein STRIC_1242 [Streptococcus ictaluri 707-05]